MLAEANLGHAEDADGNLDPGDLFPPADVNHERRVEQKTTLASRQAHIMSRHKGMSIDVDAAASDMASLGLEEDAAELEAALTGKTAPVAATALLAPRVPTGGSTVKTLAEEWRAGLAAGVQALGFMTSRAPLPIEDHVARIVLFQRLVEPVQQQFVSRPRERKRPLLDALRAEGRERRGLDAAVGVRGQQDRAVQLRPAPEDDRGRDRRVLDQSRFGSRRADGVGRGGRRRLQVGVERSRKVLVVRLREPARTASLRRCKHRRGRGPKRAMIQPCDTRSMVIKV